MTALLNPFTRPGRWFRGVFHCHTTNSDGARSVASVIAWYSEHGYDFISITDHNQLTAVPRPRPSQLLLVPGTEVDVGQAQLLRRYALSVPEPGEQQFHRVPVGGDGLRRGCALPGQVAGEELRQPAPGKIRRRHGARVHCSSPGGAGMT